MIFELLVSLIFSRPIEIDFKHYLEPHKQVQVKQTFGECVAFVKKKLGIKEHLGVQYAKQIVNLPQFKKITDPRGGDIAVMPSVSFTGHVVFLLYNENGRIRVQDSNLFGDKIVREYWMDQYFKKNQIIFLRKVDNTSS